MFFTVITHIKNSVIISFKYKLFKELFKMFSAAAQKASTKSFQIFSTFAVVDPTQPTKNRKISTQTNPWVNRTHGQLWFQQLTNAALAAALSK